LIVYICVNKFCF